MRRGERHEINLRLPGVRSSDELSEQYNWRYDDRRSRPPVKQRRDSLYEGAEDIYQAAA